jgi:hypothetical protein
VNVLNGLTQAEGLQLAVIMLDVFDLCGGVIGAVSDGESILSLLLHYLTCNSSLQSAVLTLSRMLLAYSSTLGSN